MLTALTTALLVASSDTAAPVISHAPVESASRAAALLIRATISDESGVFDAVLFWRQTGDATFTGVPLEPVPDGTYVATLPVALVQAAAVEYYLEAYDELGNGPGHVGSPQSPLRVALVASSAPKVDRIDKPEVPSTTSAVSVEEGFPVAPFVLAGAGAAVTIAGAVMWFVAAGSMDEVNARYPPGVGLKPADHEAARGAQSSSRLASGLMIGGAAATVGGLSWWLLTPGDGLTVGAGGRF